MTNNCYTRRITRISICRIPLTRSTGRIIRNIADDQQRYNIQHGTYSLCTRRGI